jgi:hypothetical protein
MVREVKKAGRGRAILFRCSGGVLPGFDNVCALPEEELLAELQLQLQPGLALRDFWKLGWIYFQETVANHTGADQSMSLSAWVTLTK